MPFRYLGVPLAAERLKVVYFEPLMDKIRSYINGWSGPTLSYAGRTEMGSKKACVAWKICCLPKHEGGLGLRDIKSWNHALSAKTLRNIHANKQTLWFWWIHHYYLRNRSIWDWTVHRDDSPLIKNILRIRDQLIDTCGSQQSAEQKIEYWSTRLLSKCTWDAYETFRPHGNNVCWKSIIWGPSIPPKYSFIMWLCILGRLKTKNSIGFMDIENDTCVSGTQLSNGLASIDKCVHRSALKWLKKEANGTGWQPKSKKTALASTVYQIWNARNMLIFEETTDMAKDETTVVMDIYDTIESSPDKGNQASGSNVAQYRFVLVDLPPQGARSLADDSTIDAQPTQVEDKIADSEAVKTAEAQSTHQANTSTTSNKDKPAEAQKAAIQREEARNPI
ncbi:hypothetical protein DH2020_006294 [Rehmannia glutinosa]|uniref:Reverse transcriptase zinc-binding domain-containing protein n=1 Tax=Rehmannia glutinosa TaxID=99300 RepID=A0ABR0XIG6_REHGL